MKAKSAQKFFDESQYYCIEIMASSYIENLVNHISESMGLSPIVLFCLFALFLFVFIFGIAVLIKLKNIRNSILIINQGLDALFQMIGKEAVVEEESKKPIDSIGAKTQITSDVKSQILRLLQNTGKPISYSDIVKELSTNYPDENYDYESVIEELDQLKGKGEITSQLYFGKLYFQINRIGA